MGTWQRYPDYDRERLGVIITQVLDALKEVLPERYTLEKIAINSGLVSTDDEAKNYTGTISAIKKGRRISPDDRRILLAYLIRALIENSSLIDDIDDAYILIQGLYAALPSSQELAIVSSTLYSTEIDEEKDFFMQGDIEKSEFICAYCENQLAEGHYENAEYLLQEIRRYGTQYLTSYLLSTNVKVATAALRCANTMLNEN